MSSDNLVPALECARDPDVSLLVGYLGGVPASTAILFVIGQVAGLTGVATVSEYRRAVFAEARPWAASGDVAHASVNAVGRALPALCLADAVRRAVTFAVAKLVVGGGKAGRRAEALSFNHSPPRPQLYAKSRSRSP